jgi:hypothetical protein
LGVGGPCGIPTGDATGEGDFAAGGGGGGGGCSGLGILVGGPLTVGYGFVVEMPGAEAPLDGGLAAFGRGAGGRTNGVGALPVVVSGACELTAVARAASTKGVEKRIWIVWISLFSCWLLWIQSLCLKRMEERSWMAQTTKYFPLQYDWYVDPGTR